MNESNNYYPNTSLNNEYGSQQNQQQAEGQARLGRLDQENETTSFDVMVWVIRFVRYWYLFVIGITVALVLAHYQNKKWKPVYETKAQVIIDDGGYGVRGYGMGMALNGTNLQAGYRNVNNQIIMFG